MTSHRPFTPIIDTFQNGFLPKRDDAMLIHYTNEGERRCWPLSQSQPTLIGRDDSCRVPISARQVSRHHAQILWYDAQYVVEDLGSTNGTFINRRPCTGPIPLHDGDEIQLGYSIRLTFVDEESTEPLSVEPPPSGLLLDLEEKTFIIDGKRPTTPLSPPQFKLLELLYNADGKILSRDEIANTVWPDDAFEGISEQAIDALVRRVRTRLQELDPEHEYVLTVRGFGFRLVQRGGIFTRP